LQPSNRVLRCQTGHLPRKPAECPRGKPRFPRDHPPPSPDCGEAYSYIRLFSRYRAASLRMRLCCSFLRACLRLARGIGSLLLALFLHNAVRFLAFPLPFPLPYVAISAATLAFPLTLRVLMELLAGTMLALLSHARLSRYCKPRAKCSNKTEISYFHSLPFFPFLFTVIELA
jgi:hypothetical protein